MRQQSKENRGDKTTLHSPASVLLDNLSQTLYANPPLRSPRTDFWASKGLVNRISPATENLLLLILYLS